MKLPPLLAAALAAAIVVALAACDRAPPPPPPAPLVVTLVAGEGREDRAASYSGEIHARHEMPLAFRIGGKLADRRVDLGARVQAGQLLARLDPSDVVLQAGQAEAQRALAEADARRYRDLYARKFVSAAALDAKETALKAAESQAGLARNQSAYASLAADAAGVIAAVLAEPGQVVAAGQPIFKLARDGEREALIDLPENAIAGLAPGAEAQVTLWAGKKAYRGRLRELSPAADPATRTYPARVTLVDADGDVALGMTATVRFSRPGPARLILPLAAVFQQDGKGAGPAVWVVGADNTLALRPVSIAAYTDAGATVTAGLNPGERIVAAGVHKLAAGQAVRVAEAGR